MSDLRVLLDFEGDRRSIAEYEAAGGYASLRKAVAMAPEEIVAAVDTSGVRGRGGAGFPPDARRRSCPRIASRPICA